MFAYVGIHQVRILVFDNYQRFSVPLSFVSHFVALGKNLKNWIIYNMKSRHVHVPFYKQVGQPRSCFFLQRPNIISDTFFLLVSAASQRQRETTSMLIESLPSRLHENFQACKFVLSQQKSHFLNCN